MLIFSYEKTKQQETENTLLDTLLGRIAIGDTAALEALYRRTQTAVYSFALSVLKNAHDAEDVLHDCYVAAWNSAAQYHSRGKPMAWLITIAKNLCLQQLRAQRKTADMPEDMHAFLPADSAGMSVEDRTVLSACMRQLSDGERQIVTLHAVAGFKHREIAAILQMPLATVLSKYNRAIKKLKQHLHAGGIGHDRT